MRTEVSSSADAPHVTEFKWICTVSEKRKFIDFWHPRIEHAQSRIQKLLQLIVDESLVSSTSRSQSVKGTPSSLLRLAVPSEMASRAMCHSTGTDYSVSVMFSYGTVVGASCNVNLVKCHLFKVHE